MATYQKLVQALESEKVKVLFAKMYGPDQNTYEKQKKRYNAALQSFAAIYGEARSIEIFSTSGRTEIGGNHTDHNYGKVLAGSVDLDTLAIVSSNDTNEIRIKSEGFTPDYVDLSDLSIHEEEKYHSNSLVRGICFRFKELGYRIGGFDAYTISDVLKGSGLSSSAAFEVLVATILNHLYNDGKIDPVTIAQIGQYAENNFFGKPCGLLDQTACSVGGFVAIDFENPKAPKVEQVALDFADLGYTLVITDTKGNHSELNAEYAAVATEMKSVAAALGASVLRERSLCDVLSNASSLRNKCGDRSILRAIHFFHENERVDDELAALKSGDFPKFLQGVIASGESSWMLNQNCYTTDAKEQGVTLGLAVSKEILSNRGAYRVHGGGFAGTIQAFVPNDLLDSYVKAMASIFGEDAPHKLFIRPFGSARLDLE